MKTEKQKKCKTLISWDAKTLALMNAYRTIDGWNNNVEVPDGK